MAETETKTEEKTPVALDTDKEVLLLNQPSSGYWQGEDGDYRLLSAVFGGSRVVLYEAVSGTKNFPPGRNMHVALEFEELERLITGYQMIKKAQEEAAEKRRREYEAVTGHKQSDDYDPFLDSDDLP